jgi:hypothetical protein
VDDQRRLARAILAALFPSRATPAGLDDAIRLELLITALEDARGPRCVSDLLLVLERLAAGEVARELLDVLRARARIEPHLPLTELGRGAG